MPRKCKICKTKFTPFDSLQGWCSPDCGLKLAKKKLEQKRDAEAKQRRRKFNEQDISYQRKRADVAFNAYIRYRDRNDCCISCNKGPSWQGQWASGHYYTKAARPDLRYNEDNVHKQCNRDCNAGRSGNIAAYRPRLIAKIGVRRFEALSEQRTIRRRAQDYAEITRIFKEKLKALKNGESLD